MARDATKTKAGQPKKNLLLAGWPRAYRSAMCLTTMLAQAEQVANEESGAEARKADLP